MSFDILVGILAVFLLLLIVMIVFGAAFLSGWNPPAFAYRFLGPWPRATVALSMLGILAVILFWIAGVSGWLGQ